MSSSYNKNKKKDFTITNDHSKDLIENKSNKNFFRFLIRESYIKSIDLLEVINLISDVFLSKLTHSIKEFYFQFYLSLIHRYIVYNSLIHRQIDSSKLEEINFLSQFTEKLTSLLFDTLQHLSIQRVDSSLISFTIDFFLVYSDTKKAEYILNHFIRDTKYLNNSQLYYYQGLINIYNLKNYVYTYINDYINKGQSIKVSFPYKFYLSQLDLIKKSFDLSFKLNKFDDGSSNFLIEKTFFAYMSIKQYDLMKEILENKITLERIGRNKYERLKEVLYICNERKKWKYLIDEDEKEEKENELEKVKIQIDKDNEEGYLVNIKQEEEKNKEDPEEESKFENDLMCILNHSKIYKSYIDMSIFLKKLRKEYENKGESVLSNRECIQILQVKSKRLLNEYIFTVFDLFSYHIKNNLLDKDNSIFDRLYNNIEEVYSILLEEIPVLDIEYMTIRLINSLGSTIEKGEKIVNSFMADKRKISNLSKQKNELIEDEYKLLTLGTNININEKEEFFRSIEEKEGDLIGKYNFIYKIWRTSEYRCLVNKRIENVLLLINALIGSVNKIYNVRIELSVGHMMLLNLIEKIDLKEKFIFSYSVIKRLIRKLKE